MSPERLKAMRERFAITATQHLTQGIETRLVDATTLPRTDVPASYDLVLVDAPCSGTGTLGRNPEIRHRLCPEDFAPQHQRQCALLRAALQLGQKRVLYSTCSLEPEENQHVVAQVISENPDWQQVSLRDQIESLREQNRLTPLGAEYLHRSLLPDGALQLMPAVFDENHIVSTDGFYLAMLERL
uniref:SAM-dependent MTase RsmB/NOP-type domain-containing protein n=1 Tax=mine drainage metagenome TaxID=410659 RepID=E6PZ06_9ZZZZ